MIWLVFAVLTAGVVLALTRPLSRGGMPLGSASEIDAYKLQLAELDREEERGTLGKDEAHQTRTEISRRLLRASRQNRTTDSANSPSRVNVSAVFIALAALISVGSLSLYLEFGKLGLPDQPLEARLNAPPEQQPVDIQIANVERRLRENPKDAMGWTVIAPVYLRLGQFDKAAEAYRRSIALAGESEDKLLGLAEALTLGNEGVIPDQAKQILNLAVEHNPSSLRGRFWLALVAEQDNRDADAEHTYRAMLSENIPDAWKSMVRQRLSALTAGAGGDGDSKTGERASADASQGDQAAMIRGMVDGLAARLKDNGADLEGWLKLIRSYTVLKEMAKAQDALASARRQFASNSEALNKIEALVQSLGLQTSDTQMVQPKT